MSKQGHGFSVENAISYGIECAILINHFQYWIDHNKAMGRNFYDGHTWMYQTQKEIAAVYPYWSEDVVYKTITKLVEKDVLIKGNYNKTPFDKTTWYAFKNEEMFTIPSNDGIEGVQRRNPIRPTTEPIPDTKPVANPILQQQASAAAPKKEEERKPGVYPCLKDIEVSIRVKQQVTKKHTLEQVEHALKWLKNNDKPLHRGLAATLIWACDAQPEIHEPKEDPYEKVKKIFTHGQSYNGHECYLYPDRIAFQKTIGVVTLNLDKYFTWAKLVEFCDSLKINIRKLT